MDWEGLEGRMSSGTKSEGSSSGGSESVSESSSMRAWWDILGW